MQDHNQEATRKARLNIPLNNALIKYGLIEEFEVLEFIDPNDRKKLSERERYWISYYKSNKREYGYNVNHDKSVNDYTAYTGSYNRSLEAVKRDLKENSSTQIIFDLHRDAVGSSNEYAPTVKIGDEYVAQIMFVIGTDGGGLSHPDWQQNLKFAIKVQQKANELYPGLFRPIIVRDSRYNQHVSKAATIIEVGATGNTLEQCLGSMKYFSKVLDEVLKE